MILYRIKGWSEHFEVADSRKRKKISAVVHPLDFDAAGSMFLDGLPDAMMIWGVWCRLREIAAAAPVRGELATGRGPLTIEQIARVGRIPPDQLTRALEVLGGDEVGWIERMVDPGADSQATDAGAFKKLPEAPQSSMSVVATRAELDHGSDRPCHKAAAQQIVAERGMSWEPVTKKKRSEIQPNTKNKKTLGSFSRDEICWTPAAGWTGIAEEMRSQWIRAFPHCDVASSLEQMSVWLQAHPARAGRGGLAHFVVNWLKRAHDQGAPRPDSGDRTKVGTSTQRNHRVDRESREYKEDYHDIPIRRIGVDESIQGEAPRQGEVAGATSSASH